MSEKYLGENSTPILINQIKDKLEENYKVMGELGAKNLLSYPYLMTTKTVNGITITDNGDGSLTVNGTPTTPIFFNLCNIDFGDSLIGSENSKYIMSDGVDHSLGLEVGYNPRNKITSLNIQQDATINNVTVYPMIRYKSDTDDTWQPYAPTNRELKQELDNDINDIWKAQEELGAKNLIKYPYISRGTTNGGITFNANNDGSIYVNGTSTSYATYHIFRQVNGFKKGNYIISCGGLTQGVEFHFGIITDGTMNPTVICSATSSSKSLVIDSTYDDVTVGLRVMVKPQTIIDNITIYPMIRLASDPNDTWIPYAPTNKELADDTTIINISDSFYSELSEGISLSDVAVYKQGKHIFGSFLMNGLTTEDGVKLYLTYAPKLKTHTFCSIYNVIKNVVLNTNGTLYVQGANGVGRIVIDYVCA